jgi:hypothetical protein
MEGLVDMYARVFRWDADADVDGMRLGRRVMVRMRRVNESGIIGRYTSTYGWMLHFILLVLVRVSSSSSGSSSSSSPRSN